MIARYLLPMVAFLAIGCSRAFYRNSADQETYPIVAERSAMRPGYAIGRLELWAPEGSRLHDPFNPDHPPKPPDDPAAAVLMAHPGKFHGSNSWERDGVTDRIEPPGWEQALGLSPDGVLKLDQDRSAQVGLLNSRDYQLALETVYTSALALTLNRFDFDVHWFGTNSTAFSHFGSAAAMNETNTLTATTSAGYTQNLIAGGQFILDFANSIVYQYSGGTGQFSSNLMFSLSQPLLRNFGRQIRLESLTQGERNLLYAIRAFARFRKQFWVSVAVQSGGYLDLLLNVQTLRNAEINLSRNEETYRLYNELFRGGRASVVELDQFYQNLQSARQTVIVARVALESAKDQFKIRLGIPPRIPLELDDRPLDRFVLTDPALDRLHDDLEAFQRARFAELDDLPSAPALRSYFTVLRGLTRRAPDLAKLAATDLDAWGQRLGRPPRPSDDPEQRERERTTYHTLVPAFADAIKELTAAATFIDQAAERITDQTRQEAWDAAILGSKKLLAAIDGVIAVQTQTRIYQIELPEIDGNEAEALRYAKENRLDLQNQLGQTTDAWRQVTITANALKGDITVTASAAPGTNPNHNGVFNFAASGSTYTAGVQIDTPLNRLAERNAYRTSLITYQQSRRAYMALSDNIEAQLRQDIRQLNALRVGFSIARQQLLSAARQYENARLTLLGPQARRGANDTTTLNLLQALGNLLNARNALAASYINFEQQRLQYLLDLEALQLDPLGFPTNAAPRSPDATGQPGGPGNPSPPGYPGAPVDRALPGQPLGPPRKAGQ
jgi:outer membrane protein TolC